MPPLPNSLPAPTDTGQLDITYLKRFWAFSMLQRRGQIDSSLSIRESPYFTSLLNALGLGLEPTIQYIFQQAPSFDHFENWVSANSHISADVIGLFNALIRGEKSTSTLKNTEKVLSEEELTQWETDGYLILKNAIPKEDCEACVKMIYHFLGANENDPSTWYQPHPAKQGIMIQLFNHPLLNKNRFAEKIRLAYQQLWERTELMVSMDRVSFNPPENEYYQFPGPHLHWDISLKLPIPFGMQGLLYLVDTAADQGAFSLVPGFHKKMEAWQKGLPEGVNPREQNLQELGVLPLAANAGDFIIWHHALPHGSSPNTAQQPRIVQYINYQPLDREVQQEWI